MRIVAAILSSFLAVASYAASVTVGCPGGTPGNHPSITAALAALDLDGPHTISVSGTCTESVLLRGRERLIIQGPATVIGAGTGPAFIIRGGHGLTLRDLVARGLSSAIQIGDNADVTIFGVTAENANGFALDVFGGASVVVGGQNPSEAVTLRNSGGGMRCEACVAFFPGWVTIENNGGGSGLLIDSGRVEAIGQRPASPSGPVQGGPIVVRNHPFSGISVTNRGVLELARANLIQNNGLTGIILNDGSANLIGSFTPDGTPMGTTIEGNGRNAAGVLFNSTFRASGPNVFQNNGTAGVQFTAAVSAVHSSMVFLTGGTISGSIGPGVSADALTTVRLDQMTISGGNEEAVRLTHGSALESIGGNNIPARSVTCDGTSIVFGNFAGVAPFECEKATKK
jgi:hypothetical protein